jgi:hypothetical protein
MERGEPFLVRTLRVDATATALLADVDMFSNLDPSMPTHWIFTLTVFESRG